MICLITYYLHSHIARGSHIGETDLNDEQEVIFHTYSLLAHTQESDRDTTSTRKRQRHYINKKATETLHQQDRLRGASGLAINRALVDKASLRMRQEAIPDQGARWEAGVTKPRHLSYPLRVRDLHNQVSAQSSPATSQSFPKATSDQPTHKRGYHEFITPTLSHSHNNPQPNATQTMYTPIPFEPAVTPSHSATNPP